MVVRKRSKLSRHRGSHTHGWGNKKKHRGAGNRGGRGNAGRGKHADHKRPSFAKKGIFLGHTGFTMHGVTEQLRAVNLDFMQEHIDQFVRDGKAEKKGSSYVVDLSALGYNKILGSGNLRIKLVVTADHFSKNAEGKIKKAGGEIITSSIRSEE